MTDSELLDMAYSVLPHMMARYEGQIKCPVEPCDCCRTQECIYLIENPGKYDCCKGLAEEFVIEVEK